jgi:hypothetical protein
LGAAKGTLPSCRRSGYDVCHFIKPGEAMTDNVAIRPLTRTMPLGLQVTVLAALSAGGTLATNILLPSLPGIAMAVGVSSAQVTSSRPWI